MNKIKMKPVNLESVSLPTVDLHRCFAEWNLKSFGGALPIPELRWNSRLKTTAGRFIPTRSRFKNHRPIIEVATYLLNLPNCETFIRDTIGHEMIHYWLWIKKRPYGHTALFIQKMKEIGVSRYNPVPLHRPFKHCYVCDECGQKIMVRRKLPKAACAACCNQHAEGQYHSRFMLRLDTFLHEEQISALQPIAKQK